MFNFAIYFLKSQHKYWEKSYNYFLFQEGFDSKIGKETLPES